MLKLLGIIFLVILVVGVFGSILTNTRSPHETSAVVSPARTTPVVPKASYLERLQDGLKTLEDFSFIAEVESVDDIATSIAMLDVFSSLIDEGSKRELTADEAAARTRLLKKLSVQQRTSLPVLRDRYGPAMRKQLWEADGNARTIGTGFRTVVFISAIFAANANIKSTHETLRTSLMKLRFTNASYKWLDADVEYYHYNMKPPADGDVVVWNGASFRVLK